MTTRTVGLIGLGKIGMPMAENLLQSGYRVVGYRRSSMAEFEALGGTPAASPAEVAAQAEIVLSCLPSAEALDDVVQGARGLAEAVRQGQVVVEFGSHAVADKSRQIAPLAARGASFVDGEISGTPGMLKARKAVVYLSGEREPCAAAEAVAAGFADACFYFGPFGAASRVKLIANLLVALNVAATAEAMSLGLKAGVDVPTMIKAVAGGAGGSTQFGIRAPWMAERRFLPPQGTLTQLSKYFGLIEGMAVELGCATPMLDRAATLFRRGVDDGLGEHDVAALVQVIESLERGEEPSIGQAGSSSRAATAATA